MTLGFKSNDNIVRLKEFDYPIHKEIKHPLPNNYIHKQLFPVKKQTKDCSDSWLLSVIESMSYLFKLELDPGFVVSCYGSNQISTYYNKGGCSGDSVYNSLIFLKLNGTVVKNSIKDYTQMCTRTNFKNSDIYKIDNFINISPILTPRGLMGVDGNITTISNALDIVKNYVLLNPVIVSYVIYEDLLQVKSEIYISNNSKIIGYHNAIIVGWGQSTDNFGIIIGYWIIKNSWGVGWGDNGYYKHAMYPHNTVSCPGISIHGSLIDNLEFKFRKNIMGGAISITKGEISELDTNKIKMVTLVKGREIYPQYFWIVMFVSIVIIFIKFFY